MHQFLVGILGTQDRAETAIQMAPRNLYVRHTESSFSTSSAYHPTDIVYSLRGYDSPSVSNVYEQR